jgi:hypothetical protein
VLAAAYSAVMNALRCPSSAHWVNNCSNWSTTSNNRCCGGG